MKTAIITLTKGSVELGLRLHERLTGSELFLPEKHRDMADGKGMTFTEIKDAAEKAFSEYGGLVFIMATGIVVRIIAPFIKGKDVDPAVVVMDEAGRFAVSLLSGHLGGANELAREVAKHTGAIPVITTGTDVCNKPCAEDIARELDCEIENVTGIKKINSAFLHDEQVAINLPAGEREAIAGCGNFIFFDTLNELLASDCPARIAVTNRIIPDILENCLAFRPKNLVVGIGCNRNSSAEEVEDVICTVLKDAGLSKKSIRNLATIDVKNDEVGLLNYAKKYDLTIDFFNKEELEKEKLVTPPSLHVIEAVGVGGVCEPAAMLSARASNLLVNKVKSGNVTMAVAECCEALDVR
ncbi:MAG: cobalt-precorrin 5A hydrolase [Deltaproteobacteria bacterium]|nr:cobalt-precorrin 5A hydrolase [Deltaproteobacteria bacterium]